jgi:hypothetical protein
MLPSGVKYQGMRRRYLARSPFFHRSSNPRKDRKMAEQVVRPFGHCERAGSPALQYQMKATPSLTDKCHLDGLRCLTIHSPRVIRPSSGFVVCCNTVRYQEPDPECYDLTHRRWDLAGPLVFTSSPKPSQPRLAVACGKQTTAPSRTCLRLANAIRTSGIRGYLSLRVRRRKDMVCSENKVGNAQ